MRWDSRAPSFANAPFLFGHSKCEHLVPAKNIAHDMKSGAEGAHFFGALLLTFSFDKHTNIIHIADNGQKIQRKSKDRANGF